MTAPPAMIAGARAGMSYFMLVFSFGFVLGTIRSLTVAPAVGEFKAVLIELPFMLLVSWFVSRWIIHSFSVPKHVITRVTMGLTAFALLLCAEALLSVFLMNLRLLQHLALYLEPKAQLGLLGQIAFAIFPLLQLGPVKPVTGEARRR
ncbi:hypothetical protein [Sulfitobacter sp. MF3-043]|uniref:hypothetical protein n=1 Tax=Sulfitobacter sediminivivens TaxID=3252902 RepID=UPI0036DB47E9